MNVMDTGPVAPRNEKVLSYLPGSSERGELETRLASLAEEKTDVPLLISGERVVAPQVSPIRCPHDHSLNLGQYHKASADQAAGAVDAALAARREWAATSFEQRAAVFLQAAFLVSTKYRSLLNAATMLGQSKTLHQAEIDSACELADFYRFNVYEATRLLSEDPPRGAPGVYTRMDYRPLDGFVLAISPFNFTAIAGNLPAAPALMGNTVVWKPASTATLSAYFVMQVLQEAGLPPGVINMVPGQASEFADLLVSHPDLAAVHFTGSTPVFRGISHLVAENQDRYRCYPRLVGETGGKNFIFAHSSADPDALVAGAVRGAFEYQGQKCSAASRLYVPRSLWPDVRERLVAAIKTVTVGDVRDFSNFMGAVIDGDAFNSIGGYLQLAHSSDQYEVLCGGTATDSTGWFVRPTLVESKVPNGRLMSEEIFGPLLTAWVYEDDQLEKALELCEGTSPYGLTGSIFAQDPAFIRTATARLRFAAGNFYINDKPTGAVVGQQPFGGSRASGTNDKSGTWLNLARWVSPRCIKETFDPPTDYRYPHMVE